GQRSTRGSWPRPLRLGPLQLLTQGLHLLLERDHLELATHDDLLELLEVEDLLLQLGLRCPEVADDALVRPHVTQDADGPDHLPVGPAQGGSVQGGRNGLTARAPRVEPGVPRDAALHDLVEGSHEFPGLLRTDEARQRLREQLVLTETE